MCDTHCGVAHDKPKIELGQSKREQKTKLTNAIEESTTEPKQKHHKTNMHTGQVFFVLLTCKCARKKSRTTKKGTIHSCIWCSAVTFFSGLNRHLKCLVPLKQCTNNANDDKQSRTHRVEKAHTQTYKSCTETIVAR